MRKAALIYNPQAGRRRGRRLADVTAAAEVLAAAGVEAMLSPTPGPGAAAEQAREAIAGGCDALLACGGDGTVNEVLQGMVGSTASLGVIPLGTGNALANDLGMPRDPRQAAQAMLSGRRREVRLGLAEYADFAGRRQARYFLIGAGIGPDAELMYRLATAPKGRFGMYAYYAMGTRLLLTHPFATFTAEFGGRRETVSEVLAMRVGYAGGLLAEVAPGASLERDDLRLVLFKTGARRAYLSYLAAVASRRHWKVEGVELADAGELRASGETSSRVLVEVDGECVGTLPARLGMAEQRCVLLVPV